VVTIPVVDSAVPRARRAHRRHTAGRGRHAHQHPWKQAGASRATVRRLVVRTARRHGVDPHLALAISWQESGWQQHRRSSTGAIGAMQVMPGTGRWMSLYVGRRLNIYSLRDNVLAGVVLVTVLRHQVSRRRAIAAYYQGLGAVQEHGLYPSTRRYTRSVVSLYHRLHRGWRPA
jgi:soluble lytic murein transglycosylase-like protein